MPSIDELITEIKRLTPGQLDEVARMVQRLSRTEIAGAPRSPAVPTSVVDEAVSHGWPDRLFTELIGSLPDLERAAQPSAEDRADL
jgi:hypothetical protein